MRVILLSILLAGSYFFFTKEETKTVRREESIDSIKLKMSAQDRDRAERLLTLEKPKELPQSEDSASTERPEGEVSYGAEEGDLEHVEEIQLNDLEEGWNAELKEMLNRLEPAEADNIHKAYLSEQESYQAEMDALMSEKQQKTSEEAVLEVEQLISQLDQKHQDKLKEIFGAHYEAVRDGYQSFMESAEE